jgi:hypothetical protein
LDWISDWVGLSDPPIARTYACGRTGSVHANIDFFLRSSEEAVNQTGPWQMRRPPTVNDTLMDKIHYLEINRTDCLIVQILSPE